MNPNNKITILTKTILNNCSKIEAFITDFEFAKGFCFKIHLISKNNEIIGKKMLWINDEVYNDWPAGDLKSDIEYFKPYILAKTQQEEEK